MGYVVRYMAASGGFGLATNTVFDTFDEASIALAQAKEMSEDEVQAQGNQLAEVSADENVTHIWIEDTMRARLEYLIRAEEHGPVAADRCRPDKLLRPAGPQHNYRMIIVGNHPVWLCEKHHSYYRGHEPVTSSR